MNSLTRARLSSAARLRDAELPEVFVLATIAAASNATYRDNARDLRRAAGKVARVAPYIEVLHEPR